MPKVLVNDKEYDTFEDVASIQDQGEKNQAIKDWAYQEREEKKNLDEDTPEKDEEKKDSDENKDESDVEDPEKDNETDDESEEDDNKDVESEEKNKDDVESDNDDGDTDPEKDDNATEEDQVKQAEERIKSFATKHNVSIEDATKEVEQIDAFKKHFDDDIDELARTARTFQQKVTQLNEEKRQQELSKQSPFEWREDCMIFHGVREDGTNFDEKYSREQIVDGFRKQNSADTDKLDDEAVFILAKRDNEQWQKNDMKMRNDNIVAGAGAIKDDFLKNLPEKDMAFKEDLKVALDSLSPYDVSVGTQSMTACLNLVKGIKYDKDIARLNDEIKKAEKRGYDKGKKGARILGEEEKKADTKGKEHGKKTDVLTETEKTKALEFFAYQQGITNEKKYELYESIALKQRKKEK